MVRCRVRSLSEAADSITEIAINERNKLYGAMGRVIKAAEEGRRKPDWPPLNPAVIARYAEAKGDPAKMW